jgi:predicted AAA+ superfamily ATPase
VKAFIPGERYISKVRPFMGKEIIKVFTGQRRVGKSYMLYQVIDEIKKSGKSGDIVYINKELADFDMIKDYQDLIGFVKQYKKTDPVHLFIDEIQEIDQFERALTHFQASGNFDIYCTGSNADMLSGVPASPAQREIY